MIALIWLLLAIWTGWQLSRLLMGDPAILTLRFADGTAAAVPRLLFRLSAAVWLGILPVTWLTYLLALLLAPILPQSIHPLLPVNGLLLTAMAAWLVVRLTRRSRSSQIGDLSEGINPDQLRNLSEPSMLDRLRLLSKGSWRTHLNRDNLFYLAVLLGWLVFGIWLMTSTFFQEGRYIHAGYSVFSDFAPHTALVSSFSSGQNWPTQYPHFANDGIAYHFMFFFLCGNLNYLGLPLVWSINLPSILGLVTFCLLLGSLALHLTGKRLTFLLVPLMMFLRSSMAFWTWLKDLFEYNDGPVSLAVIWRAILDQSTFIGNTLHDDWGLWGVNVYANQRHFLPGLSLVLIVLFLLLPDLQAGLKIEHRWRGWFRLNNWLPANTWARRRLLGAIMIACLMPYWHGSALVGLLLILAPMALFAKNRLSFLLVAVAAIAAALCQSALFAGEATRVVQPSLVFGFLADSRTLTGSLAYLFEMAGLAFPMMILAFWLPGWRRKILIAGFCLPLVFAFTVSLTPDVTVNHKLLIMTLALANIFIADLLLRIAGKTRQTPLLSNPVAAGNRSFGMRAIRAASALLLSIILMITGFQEIRIVHNVNRNSVAMDVDGPLAGWIRQNTATDAIFVTAPYHYHAFFLSGRSVWFGHAYYAWSAGHDTAGRWDTQAWLLEGGDGDLEGVKSLIEQESLDYLIVDDDLRRRDDLFLAEDFFDANFPLVAEFPALGDTKIYALHEAEG